MNCAWESELEAVLDKCGCLMPEWAANLPNGSAHVGLTTCTKDEHGQCYKDIWLQGGTGFVDEAAGAKIPCLAPCEETKHELDISRNAYPDPNGFGSDQYFCAITDKVADACSNEKGLVLARTQPGICSAIAKLGGKPCSDDTLANLSETEEEELEKEVAEYASRNLVKLDIFYNTQTARKYVWEEKMSVWSFVGSLGGLMGLFLGLSFISLAEVLYFGVTGVIRML